MYLKLENQKANIGIVGKKHKILPYEMKRVQKKFVVFRKV